MSSCFPLFPSDSQSNIDCLTPQFPQLQGLPSPTFQSSTLLSPSYLSRILFHPNPRTPHFRAPCPSPLLISVPSTKSELLCFGGMANFLCPWFPGYSFMVHPLYQAASGSAQEPLPPIDKQSYKLKNSLFSVSQIYVDLSISTLLKINYALGS